VADDIKDAGAIAGVVRFGIPWHGRIESGVLYTGLNDEFGNEVTRSWSSPINGNCWVIQKPGLPDPYAGDDGGDRRIDDNLQGKDYATYALLTGNGIVHGKSIIANTYNQAWIWIDDDGIPWSVSYKWQNFAFNAAFTMSFKLVRFGELRVDGPAAEEHIITRSIEAGAIKQADPVMEAAQNTLTLRMFDVSRTGSAVIFAVYAAGAVTPEKPLGFFRIDFSLADGVRSAAFTLLADRATTLGTLTATNAYTDNTEIICDDPEITYGASNHTIDGNRIYVYTSRIIGMHFSATDEVLLAEINATDASSYYLTRVTNGTHINYTQTQSDTYSINYQVSINGLTLSADSTRTETTSVWAISNVPRLASSETVITDSATSHETINLTISNYGYESEFFGGPNCTFLDSENTTVEIQLPVPDALENAMLRYNLSQLPAEYNWSFEVTKLYSQSLYGMIVNKVSTPTLINVVGCIGPGVVKEEAHPLTSALYASYNPQTGELAYPKTGRVNFT